MIINYYIVNTMHNKLRSPYVRPELNNELQCNVRNMWEKFTLYLYELKTAWRKHFWGLLLKLLFIKI